MKLYIIRHGETPWNKELRLQGQTDIPLNEKGRALAAKAADGMRNLPFDLAISSPLGRAMETAKIVLNGRNIPFLTDARIQEIGFGVMEGKNIRKDVSEEECPEYYRFFHAPDRYEPVEGGERIQDLIARTGDFLNELSRKTEWYGKSILISTHGAASRALLANVTNADIRDFWGAGVPKNCAVSIVELINNFKTQTNSEDGTPCSERLWRVKELDRLYYENI